MTKRIARSNLQVLCILLAFLIASPHLVFSQKKPDNKTTGTEKPEYPFKGASFGALKFRNIGPAFTSGRIADFAVNPKNYSEWYVAVAMGGVWKTVNNGTTFSPVFDNYGAYSIGCVRIDPTNTNVVWIGTGENNHQRAIGYGDGVYKSVDGGKSWKNMGLKNSRQIGDIIIDPKNPDVIFVAAEGSIWGPGGERGLYKSTDGGKTWNRKLFISEETGVNNIVMDPRGNGILYASSEQRRRHVHTKIGGGPETAIYKSTDNGETWVKLTNGLPSEHMGGMGLAISPQNPDVVYAIIEAAKESGGFFRSADRGESWAKMGSYASSGQYYNEIYCDPQVFDKLYSVETVSKYTLDGGKTWLNLGLDKRHVDDHALWLNPNDPRHFIIGGDGGVYITYDAGATYRQVSNLSVTQFYRVAVDNTEPFYWVFGGTQDNNSFGGPNQNLAGGVTLGEWVVTVGGDGFFQAIDPTDPNIVYSEYQYGNIYRYDKKSGERLYIKPAPRKDELTFKWNWDSPFFISKHKNTRLYLAANKVFRTDDRGQSWKVISDDLTAQLDRTNTWKVMGKHWSIDAVAKDVSTSPFGTIVAMAESPLAEGLLYVGTDDGLIQVSENANTDNPTWTKISTFPGVPANTYVSDIMPSKRDANIVYASFRNMLRDDMKPYLMKSSDKGKTWTLITTGLPENGSVHTLEQDHVNPSILFCGTEFGAFCSLDDGAKWFQLKNGLPTIAVYDMTIQEKENDLILATFGRGFYIMDNYSPLREITEQLYAKDAHLFPVQDALVFVLNDDKYGQGATVYRQEKEKDQFEKGEQIQEPTLAELDAESKELSPYLIFTITDDKGNFIRRITTSAGKGLNRINWDLTYENNQPIKLDKNKFNPTQKQRGGFMVMPGKYRVSFGMMVGNTFKELTGQVEFNAKGLNNVTLPATNRQDLVDFYKLASEMARVVTGTNEYLNELMKKVASLKQAALVTSGIPLDVLNQLSEAEAKLNEYNIKINGYEAKASYEELPPHIQSIYTRLYNVLLPHFESTSSLTTLQSENLNILKAEFAPIYAEIKKMGEETIPRLEKAVEAGKAPYTPGRLPNWNN